MILETPVKEMEARTPAETAFHKTEGNMFDFVWSEIRDRHDRIGEKFKPGMPRCKGSLREVHDELLEALALARLLLNAVDIVH